MHFTKKRPIIKELVFDLQQRLDNRIAFVSVQEAISLSRKDCLLDELVYRRCDEILLVDEHYQNLNRKIVELENELKTTLDPGQKKLYNMIEEMVITSLAHSHSMIYKAALEDKNNVLSI